MGDEPTTTTSLSTDQQGRDEVDPREISRTAQNVNIVRQLLPWDIQFLSMTEGGRRHLKAKPNISAGRGVFCKPNLLLRIVNARFIDEQDGGRDRSASPNYHSLIYGKKPFEKEAGSNGAEVRWSCKMVL